MANILIFSLLHIQADIIYSSYMYQKLHESFSDTKRIIPFKYLYQLGMDIETKNNTPAAFPAAVGTKGC